MTLIEAGPREEMAKGVRTVGWSLPEKHFGEPVQALAALSQVPS